MEALKNNSQAIVRALTVAVAVVLQAITMVLVGRYLHEYASWAYVLLEIISFCLCWSHNDQESYRQFWCVIVLDFSGDRPVSVLYVGTAKKKQQDAYYDQGDRGEDAPVCAASAGSHGWNCRNCILIKSRLLDFLESEGFNMYRHTDVKYFPLGEEMLGGNDRGSGKRQRSVIFLEYFIISDGVIWKKVKEVLIEKAKAGIDIRLLIDDFGCLGINTAEFRDELVKSGIRLAVFAPIHKNVDRLSFNYRNHQKITIVDGNIGYCGGINLADEYANIIQRFGHWKDTALRLEGEGVWGLTSIFLEMWEVAMGYEITTDYTVYMPTVKMPSDGFVQPFCDGPANNPNNPAEDVYTHLINKARDYVYITTPYLVIDRKMAEDLCRTARSGVDVKIVVPHIYDKWYVYMVNVANYGPLIANGVHVYEYMPGFIHSKTVVCDDECAVCGTINMDYRSFYLHYECGVFTCESSAVADIRDDIHETLKQCQEIYLDEWQSRPWYEKIVQWILHLFAPVL